MDHFIFNPSLIACCVLAFCLFNCQPTTDHSPDTTPSSTTVFAEKGPQRPNDDWYLQRSWPDGELSITAYHQGMQQARTQALEKGTWPGYELDWITTGPANIGARINTVAVHPNDDDTMLAGFARGGLWRTTNGGQDWVSVFDEQAYLAIADITYDPSDPNTIYVGTGDPNISGYPAIGDGLYRSTDGGDTWTNMGPEGLTVVSHVRVHPADPQTIFVGTMGIPFERNNERGLYRTTDGGQTWEQVLFVADQAGIIDLVMDPTDPDVLYASSWDRVRNNQESTIVGPNAKIFKTIDGGDTWNQLTDGLPTENQGRIGLTVAPTNSDHLYALYVGPNSQLYSIFESVDAGETWAPAMDDESTSPIDVNALGGFGWYFGKIRVHPDNEDDIYVLGVDLWRSRDGGLTWEMATPEWWQYDVHADKHDLIWNSQGDALLATDGGLYRSTNDMISWTDAENIPTTQFYRVAIDPNDPTYYYGGAQDNGSTGGTSIQEEWPRIFGGDGFQMAFLPNDPSVIFAETQNGRIYRFSEDSGFFDTFNDGIDPDDRRNWDMQYIISPNDPLFMYTGTYRVYAGTSDEGGLWSPISEDLTDGLVFNARYHTITCLNESPVEEGLLYVGTTDGNVWRTDGDISDWVAIYDNLPDRYIADVKPSPDYADWAYVAMSGYKDNDFSPYLFRTMDRGTTWENIAGDLPNLSINDLYVIPNTADSVIFVGTDGGVYATSTAGAEWQRLGENFPFVPVYDLEYDPADNELVAGTFARSIMAYPLDSLLNDFAPGPVSTSSAWAASAGLNLYPNPTDGPVNLAWQDLANEPASLRLLNLEGQLLWEQQWTPSTNGRQQLNVPSNLASGSYLLEVTQGTARAVLPWTKL